MSQSQPQTGAGRAFLAHLAQSKRPGLTDRGMKSTTSNVR